VRKFVHSEGFSYVTNNGTEARLVSVLIITASGRHYIPPHSLPPCMLSQALQVTDL
jgi:hypothetical protein